MSLGLLLLNQEELLALNGSFWGKGLPDFENHIRFIKNYFEKNYIEKLSLEEGLEKDGCREWWLVCFNY